MAEERGIFGRLFRRREEPENSNNEEGEIVPGKWYRVSWHGLEGIAQQIIDEEGETEGGTFEFHLKLPDDADLGTVRVLHEVDSYQGDFYLISYQIAGKMRGEVRQVFWQTEDGNYCRQFGWYAGPEFEQEKGVDKFYRGAKPLEL